MNVELTESGIKVNFESGAHVRFDRNKDGLLVLTHCGGEGVSRETLSALYLNRHALAEYLVRTQNMSLAFAII